jgi:hypothetical protein
MRIRFLVRLLHDRKFKQNIYFIGGILCLFDPWIRDGSHFRENRIRNRFFRLKCLKFFDADPGSGMKNSDPRSGKSITESQHNSVVASLERLEPGFIVNLGQFLCYWIRTYISNADLDPDPEDPNKFGSMQIRIHNTAYSGTCGSNRNLSPDSAD